MPSKGVRSVLELISGGVLQAGPRKPGRRTEGPQLGVSGGNAPGYGVFSGVQALWPPGLPPASWRGFEEGRASLLPTAITLRCF